jgi:hypothetical protein
LGIIKVCPTVIVVVNAVRALMSHLWRRDGRRRDRRLRVCNFSLGLIVPVGVVAALEVIKVYPAVAVIIIAVRALVSGLWRRGRNSRRRGWGWRSRKRRWCRCGRLSTSQADERLDTRQNYLWRDPIMAILDSCGIAAHGCGSGLHVLDYKRLYCRISICESSVRPQAGRVPVIDPLVKKLRQRKAARFQSNPNRSQADCALCVKRNPWVRGACVSRTCRELIERLDVLVEKPVISVIHCPCPLELCISQAVIPVSRILDFMMGWVEPRILMGAGILLDKLERVCSAGPALVGSSAYHDRLRYLLVGSVIILRGMVCVGWLRHIRSVCPGLFSSAHGHEATECGSKCRGIYATDTARKASLAI